jgi:hypothetical protein
MKARGLLLAGFLLLPACSANDRWQLHGNWQSTETTPACAIRFDASGIVTIKPSVGEEIRGHYTLLAGDYVDIDLGKSWNGASKHREKIVVTGSVLTLRDTDGTTLHFQRDFK